MKKIFIGVVDDHLKLSLSIRNKIFIDQNDFSKVYILKLKRYDDLKDIFRFILNIIFSDVEYTVSTNPKILSLLTLLKPKKATLFMGDPLINDSSVGEKIYLKLVFWLIKLFQIKIITVSELVQKNLKKDFNIIYNWNRPSLLNKPTETIINKKSYKAIHPGDINGGRTIDYYTPYLDRGKLSIDVYGECAQEHRNISVYPKVQLNNLLKIIESYDFIIILLNPAGDQIPGKYYDFMNCGKICLISGNIHHEEFLMKSSPENYFFPSLQETPL